MLRAGCPVLAAEPVAESHGAGVALARVARESGRSLGVCFQNRYNESATPFDWRFSTADLTAMLERVGAAGQEGVAA